MVQKRIFPIVIGILLIGAVMQYLRSNISEMIRDVDFLLIFSIGMLSGLLISDLVRRLKN